jgi:molybdenum cofactor cytidylyltransferase
VIAAVLDAGDVDEDAAAQQLAEALQVKGVEAPRASNRPGQPACGPRRRVHRRPGAGRRDQPDRPGDHPRDVAEYAPVVAGQMVATVKIIPFAVAGALLDRALATAKGQAAFEVHAFSPQRVGVVQTVLPSLKASVMDKTLRVTEARLARSGSTVGDELRVGHRSDDVSGDQKAAG